MNRENNNRQLKLKEAQRAWILFRDKHSEFSASENEGGSLYQIDYLFTTATMTEKRILELKDSLKRVDQ